MYGVKSISVAVIKYRYQGNSQKKEFIYMYRSGGRTCNGREGIRQGPEAESSQLQLQTRQRASWNLGSSINCQCLPQRHTYTCTVPPSLLTPKLLPIKVQEFKYQANRVHYSFKAPQTVQRFSETNFYQLFLAATEKVNSSHLKCHKPIFLDLDSK